MFERKLEIESREGGIMNRFLLIGPKATIQFWYMCYPHRELREPIIAIDLGYHAKEPQYEDQTYHEDCNVLGSRCYYDGTSLGAQELLRKFLSGKAEDVWKELEEWYNERFGER